MRSLSLLLVAITVHAPAAAAQDSPSTLPNRIGSLVHVQTIGTSESFGQVTDVSEIRTDTFAVLDAMNSSIVLYTADGAFVSEYGSRGNGPGELFAPIGLALRRGELLVLDRGNVRILSLGLVDGALSVRGETPLRLPSPQGFCTVDDRLFVLGLREDRLIHELDSSGQVVRSFGDPLSNDPSGGRLSAAGKLVCSPTGRLAYVARTLNRVIVFNTEGEELWQSPIPGYVEQTYSTEGGVMRPLRPEAGFVHRIATAHWLPDDRLFIQLDRSTASASPFLESRMLDVVEGWTTPDSRWPVALLVGRSVAVFYEEAPFPLIKMYRER